MNLHINNLIILCATQRCGSTMVVEDMRATGVMGIPEEYFIPWDSVKEKIDWRVQLDNIISQKASTPNKVASIKVMANQLSEIDKCLSKDISSELHSDSDSGLFPSFNYYFKNAKYVFLRRDNIVRQAISRVMSRQTGINHATAKVTDEHFAGNLLKGYSNDYNSRAKYSKKDIDNDVLNIVQENLLWESYFHSWGILAPLTLRYEEICKNSPAYLNRIAKYSGLELAEQELPDSRTMVKLSNAKNESWCSQYLKHSQS